MNRIRVFGLVLVAVAASTALLGVGTASAAKFTAGKAGANVATTGLEYPILSLTGSKFQCTTLKFSGTTEAVESAQQKLVPTHMNCSAFGFGAVIQSSGCVYNFTAGGELHIEGCANGGISISGGSPFGKCAVFVKNQSIPNAVTYSNTVGKIDATLLAEGMHVEVTQSTGVCPLTVGTHATAKTSFKFEVQAEGTTIQWDA